MDAALLFERFSNQRSSAPQKLATLAPIVTIVLSCRTKPHGTKTGSSRGPHDHPRCFTALGTRDRGSVSIVATLRTGLGARGGGFQTTAVRARHAVKLARLSISRAGGRTAVRGGRGIGGATYSSWRMGGPLRVSRRHCERGQFSS